MKPPNKEHLSTKIMCSLSLGWPLFTGLTVHVTLCLMYAEAKLTQDQSWRSPIQKVCYFVSFWYILHQINDPLSSTLSQCAECLCGSPHND